MSSKDESKIIRDQESTMFQEFVSVEKQGEGTEIPVEKI